MEATMNELEFEKVDGTPFTVVRDGEKYYVVMGNERVSNYEWETMKEAKTEAITTDWNKLVMVIYRIVQSEIELNNFLKNKNV